MKIKHWINNWRAKTHVMSSPELKVGNWHDFDQRMEWCVFDTFQWCIENDVTLEHINWSISAKDEEYMEYQAKSAQEMLDIYNWWIDAKKRLEEINSIWGRKDYTFIMGTEAIRKEEEITKEMTTWLHRVVEIRNHVWI